MQTIPNIDTFSPLSNENQFQKILFIAEALFNHLLTSHVSGYMNDSYKLFLNGTIIIVTAIRWVIISLLDKLLLLIEYIINIEADN